jgi:hypothetical protein
MNTWINKISSLPVEFHLDNDIYAEQSTKSKYEPVAKPAGLSWSFSPLNQTTSF